MYHGVYRLAEKNIAITGQYPELFEMAKAYETEGEPDFHAEITEEDLAYERESFIRQVGPQAVNAPGFELEKTSALRKTARWLVSRDVLTFHSSAVAVDGSAYLFSATSGTGKSTHARLWREQFGDRAVTINDDRPFLGIGEEEVTVYGSPWAGKHRLHTNMQAPLQGIAVLNRGETNTIRRLPKEEAWSKLIQQTYRPDNPAGTLAVMELLERLYAMVPVWELTCNMDPDAVRVSYEAMSGQML